MSKSEDLGRNRIRRRKRERGGGGGIIAMQETQANRNENGHETVKRKRDGKERGVGGRGRKGVGLEEKSVVVRD